jgi:hypothetical protein
VVVVVVVVVAPPSQTPGTRTTRLILENIKLSGVTATVLDTAGIQNYWKVRALMLNVLSSSMKIAVQETLLT